MGGYAPPNLSTLAPPRPRWSVAGPNYLAMHCFQVPGSTKHCLPLFPHPCKYLISFGKAGTEPLTGANQRGNPYTDIFSKNPIPTQVFSTKIPDTYYLINDFLGEIYYPEPIQVV